jgi:hypothetical protein
MIDFCETIGQESVENYSWLIQQSYVVALILQITEPPASISTYCQGLPK